VSALENHYQQELNQKVKHFVLRWIIIGWTAVIVINVTALGLVWFLAGNGWWKQKEQFLVGSQEISVLPQEKTESENCPSDLVCASACQELFNSSLATLAGQIKTKTAAKTTSSSSNKGETFIPLGSTRGKNFNWTDTGMQAYLDVSNYAGAKAVYFEASMSIPTANGKVFLRLVQANENLMVPGSEIWSETDKVKMVTSSAITLMPGNKLYKVQLKTSMDYEAIVDSARLRIVW
jgi:hypothetical protein